MWVLDPGNSPDLIGRLQAQGRQCSFDVACVGEGWRSLVEECHEQLLLAFPEYELLSIEQEAGGLVYRAFPRPAAGGDRPWTDDESKTFDALTERFRRRSERLCEWCGAAGALRSSRTLVLALCDECDANFSDPPDMLKDRTRRTTR